MRRFEILIAALLFLTGTAVAEKPTKKDTPKTKDAEEEVLTFTTEDLERKYGPSTKTVPKPNDKTAASDPKTSSPLEQLQARQQANRDKAARRVEARKRVQTAQGRVKELEKRVAQLRNPLLGSAKPEEGEKDSWNKADQAGRVKIAQDSLAAARDELQQALKELAELR